MFTSFRRSREVEPVSQELIPDPGFESGTATDAQGWTPVGHPVIDRSGNKAHGGTRSCLVTPSDYLVLIPFPLDQVAVIAFSYLVGARKAKPHAFAFRSFG